MELAMNRLLDQGGSAPSQPGSAAPPATAGKWHDPPQTDPPSWQGTVDMLTVDTQDQDLQRAFAASMEEQARPQSVGEEDDDMMRALAQSVNEQTPHTGPTVRTDLLRLRTSAPVALVPSVPVYRVASLFLQALLAAPPACEAFLSYSLPDNRTADMEQYWAGASPQRQRKCEDRTWADVPVRVRPHLDLVQRLQTLVAFLHDTQRAAVVTGDIEAIVPSEIVLQASRSEALHVQLESYAEAVVQAWKEARTWESERITQATRSATDAARAQFIESKATVFQSFAAAAHNAPVPDLAPPQGQPTTSITLTHTALERSVPACLWRKLAASETMDSLLITRPADVLLLNIQRQGAQSGFRIDPVLYLDLFLWNKRHGHRIDSSDECHKLHSLSSELGALEAQRKKLTEPSGAPIEPLLEQVSEYYASQNEAKQKWIQRIQQYVQRQLDDLQKQREARQVSIQDLRQKIAAQVEQDVQDPNLQTVPYDLCAAILTSEKGECVYVHSEEAWWCIEDGTATSCAFDTWAADDNGLVHLVYTRRGTNLSGYRPEMAALQQAISQDNERARSEMACVD
ncbi:hypothetical protein MCAP1_001902 [Malassezia caprae]|uniref:Uncharacterized protein n=1 Tax=Malassezia caprae TaxID=1381934 RepID=A0AAF0EAQ8_9BASI|nr:hypothetical protein MCAP1_001902 [Malassezia caprae]